MGSVVQTAHSSTTGTQPNTAITPPANTTYLAALCMTASNVSPTSATFAGQPMLSLTTASDGVLRASVAVLPNPPTGSSELAVFLHPGSVTARVSLAAIAGSVGDATPNLQAGVGTNVTFNPTLSLPGVFVSGVAHGAGVIFEGIPTPTTINHNDEGTWQSAACATVIANPGSPPSLIYTESTSASFAGAGIFITDALAGEVGQYVTHRGGRGAGW